MRAVAQGRGKRSYVARVSSMIRRGLYFRRHEEESRETREGRSSEEGQ